MGRPVAGYFDSFAAAETFDHYAEAGFSVLGTSSLNTPDHVNFTLRQPFGVAAAIIAWNMPIFFLANKAAPALMAGNTVVLKSSEKAPLTVSLDPLPPHRPDNSTSMTLLPLFLCCPYTLVYI